MVDDRTNDSAPPPRRATLRLRGTGEAVDAAVHWPGQRPAPLLVVLGVAPDVAAALCEASGCVVLVLEADRLGPARAALEWAVEHAAELDAATPAIVAASGRGVVIAHQLKTSADDRGWPALLGVVEISSDDPPAVSKSAAAVRLLNEGPLPTARRSTP
jgi:hypothetical protein